MSVHSYCKSCGAKDAGQRHETVCDICGGVTGARSSQLALDNRSYLTVCLPCIARFVPGFEEKLRAEAAGTFGDEAKQILEALEKERAGR